jgi:hypothetical protein
MDRIRTLLLISTIPPIAGCQNDDSRVAEVARAAAERQAKQSQQLAESSASLTEGARQLVESAGRSQESLVDIQRRLESQQAEIGRQRDQLEKERQAIASQRYREPIIAAALAQAALLIACLLPLVVCWLVLRSDLSSKPEDVGTEVLIEELAAEEPQRISPPGTSADVTGRLPPTS